MAVNFVNIPQEIKDNCPFCTWKFEKRKGEKKPTKVPYIPGTMEKASANDTSTFRDFAAAMKSYAMGGYDGIGIRVSNGIGAIDIDHCIREDGSLNDVAASILGILPDAYFEKSPSGTGLRGFFKLDDAFAYDKTAYYINNRSLGLEVYLPGATNRFVTITGDVYRAGTVSDDMDAVRSLLDAFMKRKTKAENKYIEPCSYLSDEQVIEHASNATNGEKFRDFMDGKWQEYFDNQSDADMSFVSMLTFWCGNVEEQIDRIFRSSGMMRPKWDRMTGDATYGQITIRNAVAGNSSIYMPIHDTAEDDFDVLDDEKHPDFKPDLSRLTLTLEQMQPHTNPRYGREEIGIGNAFADFFEPIARFNRNRGIWYVYDGEVWQADEGSLAVAELAKILADKLYTFALQIKDEDARTRYIKRVQKLQLRRNRKTMIEDAKSVHPVNHRVFDSNRYLFNCRNGTLDLKTMEFRAHAPEDFITKISPVNYAPDAACPRWEQFIEEVMSGQAAVARYFQKAVGYALTGDTSLECMFIMYGPTTRNGKTTAIETILHVLGEYGISSKPDLLAANYFRGPSNGAPSEDVARLNGARFVGISEMEQKLTMNASLAKQLTGNKTITARFLHENSFEFEMQAKIFVDTNHLPNVTDQTLFQSGRLKIIPFNRHFSEEEQDKGLKSALMEEDNLSGILNWIVEGYRMYRAEKLDEPKEVKEATDQYQKDSDRIAQFIEQCLQPETGSELQSKAVYKRYKDWCLENGYKYEGAQSFYRRLGLVYTIIKRRPWNQQTTGKSNATLLVNDVAWNLDYEPEFELIPEE